MQLKECISSLSLPISSAAWHTLVGEASSASPTWPPPLQGRQRIKFTTAGANRQHSFIPHPTARTGRPKRPQLTLKHGFELRGFTYTRIFFSSKYYTAAAPKQLHLRWSWCNNNKVHNKCNTFESSENPPPSLSPWRSCFPLNWSLVPKRLGTAAKPSAVGWIQRSGRIKVMEGSKLYANFPLCRKVRHS